MFFLNKCPQEFLSIVGMVKDILNLIWIGVPIILIIMGTLDLAKAVVTSDEKVMKNSTSTLAKRFGYAVGVFFVVLAVKLIMNMITANTTNVETGIKPNAFLSCWEEAGIMKSNVNETIGEKEAVNYDR